MKKVITEGILNNIMFILAGWALINPGLLSIGVFVAYMIVGLIITFIFAYQETNSIKGTFKQLFIGVQTFKEKDERDFQVTLKAAYNAYQMTIITLCTALGLLALANFYNYIGLTQLNLYAIAIILICANCIIVQTTFCIRWCHNYLI